MPSPESELDIHWYQRENPGWYEYRLERNFTNTFDWLDHYDKIVVWIQHNIDAPYRHARWVVAPEHARFRFRYERNYLQFLLRWS